MKKRNNRKLIPLTSSVFKIGEKVGQGLDFIPSKLNIPFTEDETQRTSLGLGAVTALWGMKMKQRREKRYQELHFALQSKYQLNGVYLASMEDENIEIRYCNKRLSKILDKAKRHRKDILAKLHFSINPT